MTSIDTATNPSRLRIDVWSDVVCPWCYLGITYLEQALEQFDNADRVDVVLRSFQLDPEQRRPSDDLWTGAEIRACGRLAALLDLPLTEAARHIVPVAATAAESVDRLRQWASGRCLSTEAAGLYSSQPPATSRRRVSRESSRN